MADNSAIEWTDATWNPTAGCSILSPGCTNCYAMRMAARLEAMGQPVYAGMTKKSKAGAVWTGKVELSNWGQVIKPLSWKKPRRIFVNSMSDLFHENLPDETIDRVFAVMALTPHHTYQVLTKRAERMREYFTKRQFRDTHPLEVRHDAIDTAMNEIAPAHWCKRELEDYSPEGLPLPNVWLGVSAERQQEADERIPHLLQTPAAIRFVSAEPLLGPIDFGDYLVWSAGTNWPSYLDWVIVGGESGSRARPMHPEWARSIRDQCDYDPQAKFFFKQWGEHVPANHPVAIDAWAVHLQSDGCWVDGLAERENTMFRVGKKSAGRLLDGKEHNAFPNPQPSSQNGVAA